jgi:hypothetical protein
MLFKYLFEDSVAREKIAKAEKDVKKMFVTLNDE